MTWASYTDKKVSLSFTHRKAIIYLEQTTAKKKRYESNAETSITEGQTPCEHVRWNEATFEFKGALITYDDGYPTR
jgi:hypothetical protein